MKFLHLSDLHLGKQMNDVSLLEDQEHILRSVLSIAEAERADAVLIAGDVYQSSAPPAEAMALFDRFLSELVRLGLTVFVISGNHDSAQRISYLGSLVRSSGVYVTEAFDGTLQHISFRDAFGDVTVWMLPFIRPFQAKRAFPEEKIASSQDAVAAVLRHAPVDFSRRNVLMCHQFITGSERCDSEELNVGGLDSIDASVFDGFDYVALGHIHKPQHVGRDTLRYAGSPLKYSFSEAGHRKSVTVVELGEKGRADIRLLPLEPLRDVRVLEGTIEELRRMPYTEDYVWLTVHDELVPPDARVTLSVTFPNMMKFSVDNSRTKLDLDITAAERVESRGIVDLFTDFYRLQNSDREPSPAHMKVMEKVLRELEETT